MSERKEEMYSFPISHLMSRFQSHWTYQTTVSRPRPVAGNDSFPTENHKLQQGFWSAVATCCAFLVLFHVVHHFCYEYLRITRRQERESHERSSTEEPTTVNVAELPKIVYRGSSIDERDTDVRMPLRPVECVVCLSKVEEGEDVRILPNCSHLFHVRCIDVWLEAHSTCPVCRSGVAPQ